MRHIALILGLAPGAVLAQTADLQSMARAQELASILASEQACGLTLDQRGIEAWIAANVAPDDLAFASNLQVMTMGQEYQQKDMTASARTAHCAAVRQAARAAGLIR
jgi:hypothetical protein